MKLSLVVPCYNEAENVAAFRDAVLSAFDGCGYDYEIVFVDDNINAVKSAKSAGMVSVGIFDKSSADAENEFKVEADGYVYRFDELLDFRK